MAIKTYRMAYRAVSLFLLIMLFSATARARIITVDDNGPADFNNIQAAIDDATHGDIVIVNPGTYTGAGNRDILFNAKAITVRSTDPNDPNIVASTIIDCNGTETEPHRGFYFNSGEDARSVLDGLTITKGFAKKGGGIQCINSSPTLSNCVFSRNSAIFISGSNVGGGGMYNENGSPSLTHCIFKENTNSFSDGAGMYNTGGRQVLTKCTFINNSILGNSSGGGMFNKNCSVVLEDCSFIGNSAHGVNFGGGICNWESNPTITNCIFIDNWAGSDGGGMCNWESSSMITNCTFILNRAEEKGGGILNSKRSHSLLTNCIFNGNSAGRKGGAMRIDHGGWKGYESNPILTNCIFTGNYAEEQGGAIHFQASFTELNNCTFSGNWAFYMGGAIYSYIDSSVSLANCIIWNNAANYGSQIAMELSNTISVSYCDIKGGQAAIHVGDGTIYWGVGNIDADPCFIKSGYWELPTQASCLYPFNGATSVSVYTTLSWTAGFGATSHDVYFGTSNPPPFIKNQTYTSFYPGIMACETTYFWRIDEINIAGKTIGDVWSFTTGKESPPPLTVYTDDVPQYVWIEGDYRLRLDSLCIDTGDPNYLPEPNDTDLDGNPRVINGRIDMGAYEYNPPVPAEVNIDPNTLNLNSKGRWIIAFIWLPEEYDVSDIDPNSILLEGQVEPERFWLTEDEQIAIAKFDREKVQAILAIGEIELTITGQLTDGTSFVASDVIKVIDKGGKK